MQMQVENPTCTFTADNENSESNLGHTEPLLATEGTTIKDTMGIDELYLKPERRKSDAVARNITLGAVGTMTLVTWSIILTNNPTSVGWFAFHPLLQTLSVSLFTYGILTLQPTSQPRTKAAGLIRHQIAIFILGFPSIALGTFAVWHNKNLRDAAHFTTWHGKLGLVCMIWILAQVVLGGGSVWFGGVAFGGVVKAKGLWKYHRFSGYILFCLLFFTVHLGGGWSRWSERNSVWEVRFLAYTFAPFFIVAGISWRVRVSKMNFT